MRHGKRGRPTKLNAGAAEKIIQALRAGAYLKTAAVFAGITPSTLRLWMAYGKAKPGSPYGTFRRSVHGAQATAEIQIGAVAFKGATSDPEYALRYLSVRWRKRWNPRQAVEVTGKNGEDIRLQLGPDLSLLSVEELRAYRALTAKAAHAPGD